MKDFFINKILGYSYLSRYLVWATDVFMSVISTMIAYMFIGYIKNITVVPGIVWYLLLCSVVISLFWTWMLKTYEGIIRHATITELTRIVYAMTLKAITLFGVSMLILENSPKYILAIVALDFVVSVFMLLILRIMVATFYYGIINSKDKSLRTLIYSTDDEASVSLANYLRNVENEYKLIGYITRDESKRHFRAGGFRMFYAANTDDLDEIVRINGISCILFTNSAALHDDQGVLDYGLKNNISMRIAPIVDINGQQARMQLRSIQIEDLLGRDEIKINTKEIGNDLRGTTIMVTGAAGSIGSELCRQLCHFDLKKLVLVDFSESATYDINLELTKRYPEKEIVALIADVRNKRRMETNISKYRPDYIFHAAAYKHVPLMEQFPCEAVRDNVNGTMTVADLAVKYGVRKFVMISTDKAVRPSSVMGATKRIAEMYVQSLGKAIKEGKKEGTTVFVTTRFGNVLGSNGSVIPLFRRQIEQGGPITVTHPEIIRYFMTIPEACKLVLEAAHFGEGNDVFVFDMGKPVKILDIARRMIQLCGMQPDKDIKIEFSGLRPGEKLYEELLCETEKDLSTENPKIFRAKSTELEYDDVREKLLHLVEVADSEDKKQTVMTMKEIVPDYKSMHSVYEKLD